MMKNALSMIAVVLALSWTSSSWGQTEPPLGSEAQQARGPGQGGSGPGRPPGGGAGMPAMPQLTQQQQAAVKALNETTAPAAQAVTAARNALNAAIYTDNPDTTDIKAKFHPRSAQYKRPRKSKFPSVINPRPLTGLRHESFFRVFEVNLAAPSAASLGLPRALVAARR
jgi:hypothetical protein